MAHEESTPCCECTPVGETTFGDERDRRPSIAIIEAVAAAEGVAPTALDFIYETIDPEAIDQLFANVGDGSAPPVHLRLSVHGWNVFVRSDGTIRVCDPDRPTDSAPVFQKPLGD